MNETIELLPCPFCARQAAIRDGLPFIVCCPSCGTTGPEGMTLPQAIEKWNTRPYRTAVACALADLKASTPPPLVVSFFDPKSHG